MRRLRVRTAAIAAIALAGCASAPLPVAAAAPERAQVARALAPLAAPTTKHLPLGGTKILGHYRVVAYYGAAGAPALGVLGTMSPDAAAVAIAKRAAGFKAYGLTVQPAMELIATVAQASPGADGDYSQPVPAATIARYLAAAHRHKMLLILDLQPGRATFLSQAKLMHRFLIDPSVQLALDPEWKVGPNQRPGGGRIGSASAASVNAVSRYLAGLIADGALPDKLLIVHEFTASMLPDRDRITRPAHVEVTFHADGFGTPRLKVAVYKQLAFPGRPFGAGFKLFLHQDSRLMRPAEVMALRPRPDVVTYE